MTLVRFTLRKKPGLKIRRMARPVWSEGKEKAGRGPEVAEISRQIESSHPGPPVGVDVNLQRKAEGHELFSVAAGLPPSPRVWRTGRAVEEAGVELTARYSSW